MTDLSKLVKPLVWKDDGTNGHETDHAFGFYEVYPDLRGHMLSRDGVDSGAFPTIDAAKAAAQAGYTARILAAIDTDAVGALVDAERERCAKVADKFHNEAIRWAKSQPWLVGHGEETDSSRIAAALTTEKTND